MVAASDLLKAMTLQLGYHNREEEFKTDLIALLNDIAEPAPQFYGDAIVPQLASIAAGDPQQGKRKK